MEPGNPGTSETLKLDNLPKGTWYVLIRVLDNVGHMTDSNQIMLVKR